MEFKFDPHQEFQVKALEAVCDLFDGQTRAPATVRFKEGTLSLAAVAKEALLSFPEDGDDEETRRRKRVAFIFSHSALREGWDNPNVFQICTLNQTASLVKKRQEVGRGIRLAVKQSGERIRDDQVNILTVVANESHRQYVENYQDEIAFEYRAEIEARYGKPIVELSDEERRKIEEEYGEGILPPPPRKAGEKKARLRKARALSEEFKELWERIKHKTRYAVKINTEALLGEAVPEIEQAEVAPPRVTITKAAVSVRDDDLFEAMQTSAARTAKDLSGRWPLPNLVDLLADLLEHTSPPVRLTRRTLLEVYRRVANQKAALDNPHEWATTAARILKEKLADHLVNGIEYLRVSDAPAGAGREGARAPPAPRSGKASPRAPSPAKGAGTCGKKAGKLPAWRLPPRSRRPARKDRRYTIGACRSTICAKAASVSRGRRRS